MANPSVDRRVGRTRFRGVIIGFLISLFFLFGWFDQQTTTTVELENAPSIRIESDAGPVEIVTGDTARVQRRDSWLFSEPSFEQVVTASGVVVRVSCPGRFPCRSALVVEVPPGTILEIVTSDGIVDVLGFDGDLTITSTADDGVLLSRVHGTADIVSNQGPVVGTALGLDEVAVEVDDGPVDLHFGVPPTTVEILGGGGAIDLVVPDVLYRLEVGTSDETVEIEVDRAAGARRELIVQSVGPVRIGVGKR